MSDKALLIVTGLLVLWVLSGFTLGVLTGKMIQRGQKNDSP